MNREWGLGERFLTTRPCVTDKVVNPTKRSKELVG